MRVLDWIILGFLAALVALAVRHIWKTRGRGCSGDCGACRGDCPYSGKPPRRRK